MNMAFVHYTVKKIVHGLGAIKEAANEVKNLKGTKAFIVTDPGLAKIGVQKPLEEALTAGGVEWKLYAEAQLEPSMDSIQHCTDEAKAFGADVIIGFGGGSALDTTKAASVLLSNEGPIDKYFGMNLVPNPCLPSILIPTTAGTGSEVTASAVITDEATHFKSTVFSYYNLPKFAILDPELIMTAPAHIAAACGVDALIHALEAYLSNNANPFSDAFAEKAMELIGTHLRSFVANRHDEEAACAMMVGSTFAGIAFAWARLGNIHAMSHPVSGFFGVAHGVANSVLMPTVIEYNALADKGRYEKIYNYISEDKEPVIDFTPDMLVDEVKKLNKDLGIPSSLSEVGVTEDKIEAMAKDAVAHPNVLANPRQTNLKEMIALYKKAL